jgi:hypothetical protein
VPPLTQVLAEASMPLFALRPGGFDAFVGTVAKHGDPAVVTHALILYLDEHGAAPTGIGVSCADPRTHGDEPPLQLHLGPFAARFDERFLPRDLKPRAFELFPADEFRHDTRAAAVAGMTVGVEMWTHRESPLRLLRSALRRGEQLVDLGVAGWGVDVVEVAARLEPVDLGFAKAFDAPARS